MPLHFGRVPGFLTERMGKMGDAIVESIVENLMLAWPRSAHTVVSFMVVNGLQLEAVRPECVFDQSASATELPWFFIFAIAKVTIPLLLLVSLALVCGRRA